MAVSTILDLDSVTPSPASPSRSSIGSLDDDNIDLVRIDADDLLFTSQDSAVCLEGDLLKAGANNIACFSCEPDIALLDLTCPPNSLLGDSNDVTCFPCVPGEALLDHSSPLGPLIANDGEYLPAISSQDGGCGSCPVTPSVSCEASACPQEDAAPATTDASPCAASAAEEVLQEHAYAGVAAPKDVDEVEVGNVEIVVREAPVGEQKYVERRRKNNEASRMCRQQKKRKFVEMSSEAGRLEEENSRLKVKVLSLEAIVERAQAVLAECMQAAQAGRQ